MQEVRGRFGDLDDVVFARSETPSATGSHFFRLRLNDGTNRFFVVWSSQVGALMSGLRRVASLRVEPWKDVGDGRYPLHVFTHGLEGLAWFVYVKNGRRSLILRRYEGSFSRPNEERAFTRYLRFGRVGKWPAEFRVPLTDEYLNLLRDFLRALEQSFLESVRQFGGAGSADDAAYRILVTYEKDGQRRGIPFDIGLPGDAILDASVVEGDIRERALTECASTKSLGQLEQALGRLVDEETLGRLLPWNVRYSDFALRSGFVTAPHQLLDGREGVQAHRDKTVYLTDPTLCSLLSGSDSLRVKKESGRPLPCPQYASSDGPPYSRAMARAEWTSGVSKTRWGWGPLPSPERSEAVRRLSEPTPALHKYRWKVLQLAALQAAACLNWSQVTDPGDTPDVRALVLDLQRLSLAAHDAQTMFRDDGEDVSRVVEFAESAHASVLSGGTSSFCQDPTLPGREG